MRSAQPPAASAAMQTCAPRTKSARRNRSARYFISLFRSYRYWCRCIIAPFFTIPRLFRERLRQNPGDGGYLPPTARGTPLPAILKMETGTPTHPSIPGRRDYPPSLALAVTGIRLNLPTETCYPDNPRKEKREGAPPLMGGGSLAPVPARKKRRGGYPSLIHYPDLIAGMTIL